MLTDAMMHCDPSSLGQTMGSWDGKGDKGTLSKKLVLVDSAFL